MDKCTYTCSTVASALVVWTNNIVFSKCRAPHWYVQSLFCILLCVSVGNYWHNNIAQPSTINSNLYIRFGDGTNWIVILVLFDSISMCLLDSINIAEDTNVTRYQNNSSHIIQSIYLNIEKWITCSIFNSEAIAFICRDFSFRLRA